MREIFLVFGDIHRSGICIHGFAVLFKFPFFYRRAEARELRLEKRRFDFHYFFFKRGLFLGKFFRDAGGLVFRDGFFKDLRRGFGFFFLDLLKRRLWRVFIRNYRISEKYRERKHEGEYYSFIVIHLHLKTISVFANFFRYRVIPAGVERVASKKPSKRHKKSFGRAERFDCFPRVIRATRIKPAGRRKKRRNQRFITPKREGYYFFQHSSIILAQSLRTRRAISSAAESSASTSL